MFVTVYSEKVHSKITVVRLRFGSQVSALPSLAAIQVVLTVVHIISRSLKSLRYFFSESQ